MIAIVFYAYSHSSALAAHDAANAVVHGMVLRLRDALISGKRCRGAASYGQLGSWPQRIVYAAASRAYAARSNTRCSAWLAAGVLHRAARHSAQVRRALGSWVAGSGQVKRDAAPRSSRV